MVISKDDKAEYIKGMLARTDHKSWENYVITRIWHKLDRLDVKLVTQQYVIRPNGYAKVDLFLPQINMFIEIDEPHHKHEIIIDKDKIREKDVINVTNNQIIRIDCDNTIEKINQNIDNLVLKIRKRIREQSESFVPWNIAEENDPQTYIKKGKISLKDNVPFRTCKEVCNCFGYNFKGFQHGIVKHPLKSDTYIAFPKLYPHGEWLNEISKDGNVIRESNKDQKKNLESIRVWLGDPRNIWIVFAQGKDALGIMRYRFKGVFKLNRKKTEKEQRAVWEKISDDVDTEKPRNT